MIDMKPPARSLHATQHLSNPFETQSVFITHIPTELTVEQLKIILEKFGTIIESHSGIENNSLYVKCTYSSVSEAENALTLNDFPPYNLSVKMENRINNNVNSDESKILSRKLQKQIQTLSSSSKCKCVKMNTHQPLDKFLVRIEADKCKVCLEDRLFIQMYDLSISNNGCDCLFTNNDEEIVRSKLDCKSSPINEKLSVMHLSSENMKLKVETIQKLSENNWLCLVANERTLNFYDELCKEFVDDCNKTVELFRDFQGIPDKIVAVQQANKEWYRALILPNNSWALIDTGDVIINSDVMAVIPCPERYLDFPIFCYIIVFELETKIKIRHNYEFKLVYRHLAGKSYIQMSNDSTCYARIKVWDPIEEYCKNTDIPCNVVVDVMEEFDEIHQQSKDDDIDGVKIECGDNVIIVHYINGQTVYVRADHLQSKRRYNALMRDIFAESTHATCLRKAPRYNDVLIHKTKQNKACRVSVEIVNDDDTCDVYYLDKGKKDKVDWHDLYVLPKKLKGLPILITKISLANLNSAIPNKDTRKYIGNLVKTETPLSCVFTEQHEVYLRNTNNNENVNEKIRELMISIVERVKKQNKKVTDLPVLYEKSIKHITLDSTNEPFELFVTLTSHINEKFVFCTIREKQFLKKFNDLVVEINDYCADEEECYMPRRGELCLALREKVGKYHRALAHKVSGENVILTFIDYGDMDTLNMRVIKKMIPEFMDFPQMADVFYLMGLPNECSEQAMKRAAEIIDNQVIRVTSLIEENKIMVPKLIETLREENLI